MERIWYLACLIAGLFIALFIFGLGYRKLAYPRKNSRWFKELWFSTMVILALLTTTFCNKESSTNTAQIQQHQTQSFTELQKMWQKLNEMPNGWSIKPDELDNVHKKYDKLSRNISVLMEKINKESPLSDTIKSALGILLNKRIYHLKRSIPFVTCYEMSLEGYKQQQTLDDLEQQYDLLEKMRKEGKVDFAIFNKVRATILSDYDNLMADWETNKSVLDGLSNEEKNKLVDFIIGLSGVVLPEEPKSGQIKLEDTPEWKAVIEQWEVVSQLKWDQKTTDELGKIHKETEKRLTGLARLADKGLISIALAELISNDFKRVQEVKPINVTCYKPMPSSPKYDSWLRLQARIPLLEKAVITGKINQWAYQKIVLKIKQDLETLGSNTLNDKNFDTWYKKSNNITDEQIEAIKKKAYELIEKIEKDGNYK